jgi:hypothetical protein
MTTARPCSAPRRPTLLRVALAGLILLAAAATSAFATVSPESITLTWVAERDGRVYRLFESDPVARVRVADPEARKVEVLVGSTHVEVATAAGEGAVFDLPVAVARAVEPGRPFTLTVAVTAADGTRVEQSFGPVTIARSVPGAVRLRWKWGSPGRVRLDWRVTGGDTPPAHYVVRRGAAVLARLPAAVLFYRVSTRCTASTAYAVAGVSADGVEGPTAQVTVPAGTCPRR